MKSFNLDRYCKVELIRQTMNFLIVQIYTVAFLIRQIMPVHVWFTEPLSWLSGKESTGQCRRCGLILEWERSSEERNATHSSILAWKNSMDRGV